MQEPKIEIVHPSFEVMTPIEEIIQFPRRLELAGRTCYRSEGKITEGSADKLIEKLIKSGHESVLEHCSITVRYVMDRTASHQLVRHRISAFSQESQRFCNYGKSGALRVIIPEALLSGASANEFLSEGVVISEVGELGVDMVFSRFLQSCLNSYGDYLYFLEAGMRPEDARLVLPGATATTVVTTFNLRQWRHFFDMRCDKHAQRQIRMLALGTLRCFVSIIPSVFKDKLGKFLVRKDVEDA